VNERPSIGTQNSKAAVPLSTLFDRKGRLVFASKITGTAQENWL
jgi:hypothetical protein